MTEVQDSSTPQSAMQRTPSAALKLIVLCITITLILCAGALSLASAAKQQIQTRANNSEHLLQAIGLVQRAQDIISNLLPLKSLSTTPEAHDSLQQNAERLNRSHQLVWTLDDLSFLLEQEQLAIDSLPHAQQQASALRKKIQASSPHINQLSSSTDPMEDVEDLAQQLNQELITVRLLLQEQLEQNIHVKWVGFAQQLQTVSLLFVALLIALCTGLVWLLWRWWHQPFTATGDALYQLARNSSDTQHPVSIVSPHIPPALASELHLLSNLIAEGNRLAVQAARQAIGSRVSQQLFELAKTIPGVVFQYEYLGEGTRICHFVSPKVFDFFLAEPSETANARHLQYPDEAFSLGNIQAHDLTVPLGLTRSLFDHIFSHPSPQLGSLEYDTVLHIQERTQWIRTLATVTQHPNGSTIVNGVWLDVTENIEQASALARARNTAEQVAEEKARLLAVMSHEIRTPLNGILGMAQLALKGDLPTRQVDRVEKILSSGHHLMGIVNDILDFSKIESGQVVLERTAFSLQQIVADVGDLLAPRAAEKGLEFWIEVPASLEDHFLGDPYRIRQILINFVANAIKFTPAGDVCIKVSLLETTEQTAMLHFEVRDTGIGISSEDQKKLFQAFRQADVSTTRKYGGTGLGLAISSHFAQLLSGQTGVHSQQGQGSQFWFTAIVQRTKQPKRDYLPAIQGKKVLLVESHTPTRNALYALLTQVFNCDVTAVSTGQTALGIARKSASQTSTSLFDLCLIASRLVDGEASHFIAALHQVPCPLGDIWLSAPPESIPNEMALAPLGVTRILPKPVGLITLQKAAQPNSPLALKNDTLPNTINASQGQATLSPPKTKPHTQTGTHDPIRLLVVDDNALNRTIAGDLLEGRDDLDIQVDFAEDGAAALAAVTSPAAPRYDAVLMDLQMPLMDGFAATRAIRSAAIGGQTPIFAMSAHHGEPEQASATESGVNGFIHKPIIEAQLWAVLEQWKIVPTEHNTVAPPLRPSNPTALSKAVFDPSAWHELKHSLSAARATQLAERFLEQSSQQIVALKQAVAQNDVQQAGSLLHQLSGTAGTFGLLGLGKQCGQASDALRNNTPLSDLTAQLAQIEDYATTGHAALRALL